MVEQEAAKQQREQHDKDTKQIRHSRVLDHNADEQAYHRRRQIEEN